MRPGYFLLLLFAVFAAMQANATDVHRCIGADGGAIFTDAKCEDIGAIVRPVPAPAIAGTARHLGPRGCSRTLGALREGLRSALASGDVNQLASYYNWPGISSSESVRILDRLQAIVDRPLTSIHLVGARTTQDADGYRTVASEQEPARGNAIEIVQARSANDPTVVRTQFGLARNADCWWVQF
jgi:hypothetical protein